MLAHANGSAFTVADAFGITSADSKDSAGADVDVFVAPHLFGPVRCHLDVLVVPDLDGFVIRNFTRAVIANLAGFVVGHSVFAIVADGMDLVLLRLEEQPLGAARVI